MAKAMLRQLYCKAIFLVDMTCNQYHPENLAKEAKMLGHSHLKVALGFDPLFCTSEGIN